MKAVNTFDDVRNAARFIRSRFPSRVHAAIILGSGLDSAIPKFKKSIKLSYETIPGFSPTTVKGHSGTLILGILPNGKTTAILQGRRHYYEGVPMETVALPIRVLGLLGLNILITTAAVGSLRKSFKPGHIVAIEDHINLMGVNPLRGTCPQEFGELFPDMSNAYDAQLRSTALDICRRNRIPCGQAVYIAVSGPSYETPAEIRAFKALGADVVGMSMAPETVFARQIGVKVLGLSWISNMAAGMSKKPITHAEVLSLGKNAAKGFERIFSVLLNRI